MSPADRSRSEPDRRHGIHSRDGCATDQARKANRSFLSLFPFQKLHGRILDGGNGPPGIASRWNWLVTVQQVVARDTGELPQPSASARFWKVHARGGVPQLIDSKRYPKRHWRMQTLGKLIESYFNIWVKKVRVVRVRDPFE